MRTWEGVVAKCEAAAAMILSGVVELRRESRAPEAQVDQQCLTAQPLLSDVPTNGKNNPSFAHGFEAYGNSSLMRWMYEGKGKIEGYEIGCVSETVIYAEKRLIHDRTRRPGGPEHA
jgi:hypothetical protein